MGVGPVHLYFLEEGELRVEILLDKFLDVLMGACFLIHELIAGEGEQFEAFLG